MRARPAPIGWPRRTARTSVSVYSRWRWNPVNASAVQQIAMSSERASSSLSVAGSRHGTMVEPDLRGLGAHAGEQRRQEGLDHESGIISRKRRALVAGSNGSAVNRPRTCSRARATDPPQRLGARRQLHPAADPDQEGIAEQRAQPREGVAGGRLRQPDAPACLADAGLRQQGIERDQQVEIERGEIHRRIYRMSSIDWTDGAGERDGGAGGSMTGRFSDHTEIAMSINGEPRRLAMPASATLLDALRDELGLTGAKRACDRGTCGACTVLVDDRRIYACLALAALHDGRRVVTIEGLARGGELHPLQRAFVARDALQCGYCTSGQILSAVGLLGEGAPPTRPACAQR